MMTLEEISAEMGVQLADLRSDLFLLDCLVFRMEKDGKQTENISALRRMCDRMGFSTREAVTLWELSKQ